MKIELIDSAGKSSLEQQFRDMFKSAASFDIATAFITGTAVRLLDESFTKNHNLKGRLLTGLYHCFNSKETLQQLLNLSKKFGSRLNVKISRDRKFHWKYYYFSKRGNNYAYLGSANFTGAGMNHSGELQVKVSTTSKDKAFDDQCKNRFNQSWENALNIQAIPLYKYKSFKIPQSSAPKLDKQISDILFSKKRIVNMKPALPIRLVKTLGGLKKSTEKIISANNNNWDRQHWDYFSLDRKSEYDSFEANGCHFLISKLGNEYTFHLIRITDKDKILTDEGNYFVAYKEVKRFRKETMQLKKILAEIGIVYRTNKNIAGKLTKKQSEAIGAFYKL